MKTALFSRVSLALLTTASLGLAGITATGPAAADTTNKLPSILTDTGSSTGSGTGSWDPQIKRDKGIEYNVVVHHRDITYTATGVPRVGRPPLTLPGSCQTAVVDIVRALPVVGPDIFRLIRGEDVDVAALVQKVLGAEGVIGGQHLLRTANSAGIVTGTFSDLPPAVYLVATVCNVAVNRNNWGAATARVRSDGNGSLGSSGSSGS
ncbi:MAG TPA: hypothetical protein PK331_00490 [Gordonia sp. (in: high G+C Gram-positive bacteria)]|uniref:hypothetical protein n=1 Tax=unclassified Gordonia (in: high G+C Gram-positive bacteria) TaxID=2657482 RepID=UPI000F9F006A|nr:MULTISPECIES: hypothetical protein [unclassified Gordonia (in: high G+C Gram-positive bacteria)]RUP40371.1 MAG: hypothetical protein EKK60_04030 [Gordonia sp. (in: high G+C Gram-positive bacteria)]HNP57075.1 hypothetical protein [Gordonia sp. (in: high G+C Gram-positive bacteria)]HRC49388.1 hypothetical protein [Gordonia sp. (in: high G+C Gram-positive bacteria)]